MGTFRIGCQTYTWEMLGAGWKGSVDDILDIIAAAGYSGVEITNTMIGGYYDAPESFADALRKRNLSLAAFGFVPVAGFTEASRRTEEIARARKGVDFISRFPSARFDLAGGSTADRSRLQEKFETMIGIYNEVAGYAAGKGVPVDVHPHSHAGSIIETAEEYEKLMKMTDRRIVGWCPDTGHIVRGGLDLLGTLQAYRDRIRHIHFKDVDEMGKWKMMGSGVCDFKKVIRLLETIGYDGWIIGEEESESAAADQKAAVTKNRNYLRSCGY
jgi:inosose dehydratase